MSRISKLEELLEQWRQSPDTPNRDSLAANLLSTVQEVLETPADVPGDLLKRFLDLTGDHHFLSSLPDSDSRYRWADTANRAIAASGYHLRDLFRRSVHRCPERPLFEDRSVEGDPAAYSYRFVTGRVESLAAAFYRLKKSPRVAILASNSMDGACCDLACLMYDILVTPLNVHFGEETLSWTIGELDINLVITDTAEHYHRLEKVRSKLGGSFDILAIDPLASADSYTGPRVLELAVPITASEAQSELERRPRLPLDQVATVMFTSGSTGKPKGISFSMYNLISKRFCRAAALPNVGDREKLICFLPLFHTFGRYFEMMGMVYWSGTYVFPGNPSAETLFTLLPEISPTGLISVPVRWQQIHERCLEVASEATRREQKEASFRLVVGERLRWGLSAAGYLPPQVFRYFNQYGVALCSGFGMTEGTGGITMTPPREYRENSIGRPLPGIRVRQTGKGELKINGAYVARYLDEAGPGDRIPISGSGADDYWLATGDLFKLRDDGHFEIIDRLKDIYKNNRGQTVAPRKIEMKFEAVPGFRRTFLVGDARAYNVLLVVPDREDPVMRGFDTPEQLHDYVHHVVGQANADLAPYERVVNFAVLDRDFTIEAGELTPKGSFRRKNIETNFKQVIDGLYRSPYIEHGVDGIRIRIPRWLIRDLGILESDIEALGDGLFDRYRSRSLLITRGEKDEQVQIGDLVYTLDGGVVDLGVVSRQPAYWLGNSQLISFCPCKEGWDVRPRSLSAQAQLPPDHVTGVAVTKSDLGYVRDQKLLEVNDLVIRTLRDNVTGAAGAVRELGRRLRTSDRRLARVIRHRLEALSRHPEFDVRTLAYQVLLMDRPSKDYSYVLPSFIESGLPFLNEKSIQSIATRNLSRRRLEALRQRLSVYRTQLKWPADAVMRGQFVNILTLLRDFANYHPEFYDTVRSELASWVLHREDPEISRRSNELFAELYQRFEARLADESAPLTDDDWDRLVVFGDDILGAERKRLQKVLYGTTFLRQSVMLAFDEAGFELDQVKPGGIWITRILARRRYRRYRISVNTHSGRHFDLQVILSEDVRKGPVLETIHWLMAISGYPYGPRVLPRLGCCRPELGARSLVYLGDLTVWEKIREFSTSRLVTTTTPRLRIWRKLLIRGMAGFFRLWRISRRSIVPGMVVPENVVVPEQDFREGSVVTSLTDWTTYENTLSLVRPMLQNFIRRTTALYPWTREFIRVRWIFDACVHDLGRDEAGRFLRQLQQDLADPGAASLSERLSSELDDFLRKLDTEWWVPLPVQNAIDRFHEWRSAAQESTPGAREQIIGELIRLYRFDRYSHLARFYLYRHTYFYDAPERTLEAFDRLLEVMFHNPKTRPHRLIELSELQSAIDDEEQRRTFARLVFPRSTQSHRLEVTTVGEDDKRQVIVTTRLTDKHHETYVVRTPTEPAEIGQLYRLFFKGGYPKTMTEHDRFLVVVDDDEQIVGGLCYRTEGEDVVHLDGSVISPSVSARGIGSALLEDFCTRMANEGMQVMKTHYFMRNFYLKRGFRVDHRWGALVRFLRPPRLRP